MREYGLLQQLKRLQLRWKHLKSFNRLTPEICRQDLNNVLGGSGGGEGRVVPLGSWKGSRYLNRDRY